jgi:hypothetical protein
MACAPCSHHSLDNSSTTHLHQCLILGKVEKYNHVVKASQPMMLVIPLEDTIATLHQLHPLPLNHVPSLIFYYQLKHIFVFVGFYLHKF